MSAPRIDFAPARRLTPVGLIWIGLLLLALAITSALAWPHWYSLVQLRAEVESGRAQQNSAAPRLSSRASILPEQLLATNDAISSLNIPWVKILAALDQSKPESLALLELESHPLERKIKLMAEAEQANELYDFVDTLQQQALFLHVTPLSQDRVEPTVGNSQARLRLSLEVEWR